MKYSFGFAGAGNMGGALLDNAAANNPGVEFAVFDICAEKAEAFEKKYKNVHYVSETELISECGYIVLGLKPQVLPGFLTSHRDDFIKRQNDIVFISMAAGFSVSKIISSLGFDAQVIRIMPNTPAKIGKGMILYTASDNTGEENLNCFLNVFSKAGILDRLNENLIDAASAVSGCGPAFLYIFAEALADGAVECGLPRDKAKLYAAAMLEGSAAMLLSDSGTHSAELKDAVCSPGGTTIAGVHALEEHGFRAAAIDAVVSAYKRTLELK